jgi:hypothetical protein
MQILDRPRHQTIPALALEDPREGRDAIRPNRQKGLIDRHLRPRLHLLGLTGRSSAVRVLHVLYGGGWHWGVTLPMEHPLARQAATASFLGIVIMQVGNVFACRSSRESTFSLGFFSNRLVLVGIAVEIVIAALIIYTPSETSCPARHCLGRPAVLLPFAALPFFTRDKGLREGLNAFEAASSELPVYDSTFTISPASRWLLSGPRVAARGQGSIGPRLYHVQVMLNHHHRKPYLRQVSSTSRDGCPRSEAP